MNENICKIEAKGFQDLCNHIRDLEEKNKTLEKHNRLLSDELTYFKEHCADLEDKVIDLKKQYDDFYEKEYMKRIEECNNLWGELFDIKHMSVWEFANKYCNEKELEEAGHAFARSLLGKPMTQADIAEEKFISEGEAHYERTAFIGDDF